MAPLDHPFIKLDQHDGVLPFVIYHLNSSFSNLNQPCIYYRGWRQGCRLLRCGSKDVPSSQQRFLVTFDLSKVTNASTLEICKSPNDEAVITASLRKLFLKTLFNCLYQTICINLLNRLSTRQRHRHPHFLINQIEQV
ncbi:hypothetical protein F887_00119 [Acinetobacter sp. NIPH 2100]|nr:hypothetical protein F887_00119 [Acinetobacter sp. NIPH 2100]